ncbi:MAG: hypothetical protein AB7H90_03250 [Alphaproteobacteria bacterium]
MHRASLAAAILGLGMLLTLGPAHAAPPQEAGVIPAQWGGPPPAAAWQARSHCRQLRRRLRQLQVIQEQAPPWERAGLRSGIVETRQRLRYECPGY